MINWNLVICFVGMVFYFCFCIYHFIDLANYMHNKTYSFYYRVALFAVCLCFMIFGSIFLFFIAKAIFLF